MRFAIVLSSLVSIGCGEDACDWIVEQVDAVEGATLTAGGAVESISKLALTTRANETGRLDQAFYLTTTPQRQYIISLTVSPLADGVTVFDGSAATVTAYDDHVEIWTAPLTGQIDIDQRAPVHCEEGMAPGSLTTQCAVSLDASVIVEAEMGALLYRFSTSFTVDQQLTLRCRECSGIEGCDY